MYKKRAIALCIIGGLQIFAALFHLPGLKAVAAAIAASPAPRIFTATKGLESFSTKFYFEWQDENGNQHSLHLTPELASRIEGPYNRRNVYGAVLAFGPLLVTEETTREMFFSVSRYAVCDDAPLLYELGIDTNRIAGDLRIRLEPLPGSNSENLPLSFDLKCH